MKKLLTVRSSWECDSQFGRAIINGWNSCSLNSVQLLVDHLRVDHFHHSSVHVELLSVAGARLEACWVALDVVPGA